MAFEFDGTDAEYVLELPEGPRDVRPFTYLSLRAAQMTRHPFTTAVQEDLTFSLRLTDGEGRSSTIGIGSYGGGIEEPYQRTGCGEGAGWGNEFETIRVRLTDFQHTGAKLDLSDLVSVGLHFGPGFGSAEGRLVLDDVQFESMFADDRRNP